MGNIILEIVEGFCKRVCKNLFEDSYIRCLEKYKASTELKITYSVTEIVVLQRDINYYCQKEKSHFWILYYHTAEQKVEQACTNFGSTSDKCKDYLLERLPRHIRLFNRDRDSKIFSEVYRLLLYPEESIKYSDIVVHYKQKIEWRYQKELLEPTYAKVILQDALYNLGQGKYINNLSYIIDGYQSYDCKVLLCDAVAYLCKDTKYKPDDLYPHIITELIYIEKFLVYLKKPIRDRVIDFSRSRDSKMLVSDMIVGETVFEKMEYVEEAETSLLDTLNKEQKLILKLKHGFRLNNTEFLDIIMKLDYSEDSIIKTLSNEEKFYIRLLSKYKLSKDSPQLSQFDSNKLEKAISQKIASQKKNLQQNSSNSYQENSKREIYLKLIYHEPLLSREIGKIIGLSAKQVDKKIENSKKKVKSSK